MNIIDDIERCIVQIPDDEEFVVNPILDYFTILERVKPKIVYSRFFGKYLVISERLGTYPIYLPEIGYLLLLEVTSRRLDKQIYNDTKDYESFYSGEKIMVSKIYNYDCYVNRFVTRGNYVLSKIQTDYYYLYISNLINDLLTTPSIIRNYKIFSPNRWFILESRPYHNLEAEVNYNIGIIYISRESLKNPRKLVLWMNSEMTVWEVKAGFINFTDEGRVQYFDRVPVHFTKDPSEENFVPSGKGNYFICSMFSFNNYKTDYPKFNKYKFKFKHINLIENLVDLVYSPYVIIPFLIPNIISFSDIEKRLIYEFVIKKHVFNRIVQRLIKFSPQHYKFIDAYEEIIKKYNKLFHIMEDGNNYNITMFNPTVIPFLIKEYFLRQDNSKKRLIDEIISDPSSAIEKLKIIQNEPDTSLKWMELSGIGPYLKLRDMIMKHYIKIARRKYQAR